MTQQGKCLNKPEVHPFEIITVQELKEFDCVNRVQYCRNFPEFHAAKYKDIPEVSTMKPCSFCTLLMHLWRFCVKSTAID